MKASVKAYILAFIKSFTGEGIRNPVESGGNILTELNFYILTEDGFYILKEAS